MLIDHYDHLIVRRKTRNLDLCFGTNVGTKQAKIKKNSISPAIRRGFLRSLVSAIRCEANKVNRRHEERPIGSHTVKILRDLLRRCGARGLAQHVAPHSGGGERAHRSESTYAQQVDMMSRIVAHNRLRDGSLENATCARGTNRAKLNAWTPTPWGGGESRLFSRFSSFTR